VVRWVFAAVFAVVGLLTVVRLFARRVEVSGWTDSRDRSADVSHGLMSLGMAAMFSPWETLGPPLYWQAIFSVAAGWFAVRLLRRGSQAATSPPPVTTGSHDLHHVLSNGAMVYMFAAVPAGLHLTHGTHPAEVGSSGIALPALAWALVFYFLGYAVWLGARLIEPVSTMAAAGGAALGGGLRGLVTSPHVQGCGFLIQGVGMSYMLVTML
jgi:Domain of unknown function (DUF5134)